MRHFELSFVWQQLPGEDHRHVFSVGEAGTGIAMKVSSRTPYRSNALVLPLGEKGRGGDGSSCHGFRMEPFCSNFTSEHCRSCTLMEKGIEAAFSLKVHAFKEIVTRIHPEAKLCEAVRAGTAVSSRVKAKLSVHGSIEEPVLGLTSSDLEGIELLDCPLHLPVINQLIVYLKTAVTRFRLEPYDIRRRTGELKGLIITSNHAGSEIIVRLVLRSRTLLKCAAELAEELTANFPFVKVVSVNLQPIPHAILEGEEEILLTPEDHIWERYGETSVAFGPKSFVQVTPEVARQLYAHAAKIVARLGTESLLDLFCGVGGFSLSIAPSIQRGLGIELSADAIRCARAAADRNGFSNLAYEASDVQQWLALASRKSFDCILVNPPRRGLGKPLTDALKGLAANSIVYSSCNGHTLLRDIELLGSDFRPSEFRCFDMFPLTEHMEILALLTRN